MLHSMRVLLVLLLLVSATTGALYAFAGPQAQATPVAADAVCSPEDCPPQCRPQDCKPVGCNPSACTQAP